MVSNIKTLIIFDTNVLRSTKDDKVLYCTFEFGSPFEKVESFILKNGLSDFVEVAIPRIALDELNRQKSRSYFSDVDAFSGIYSRLSQTPNYASTVLPDRGFDYKTHIEKLSEQYLNTKRIRIIEIPDDDHQKEAFQRIIKRALDTQPPFKQHHEHSDVGFKDALIWESILSYDRIKDFDKVILLTKDSGFDSKCAEEFDKSFKKYFSIQLSEDDVTDELGSDYADYIKNRDFIIYAKSDYFGDHLREQLSGKSVLVDTQVCAIVRFEVLDPCDSIETAQDTEQGNESEETIINSKIKLVCAKNEVELELILRVSTLIDEAKNIIDVRFDRELVQQ